MRHFRGNLPGRCYPTKTEPLQPIGVLQQPTHPHDEHMMSDSEFRITISETGSYKIEGPVPLVDHDGNAIETRDGKPFFLCRCGHSANKPFCDGAHNRVDWDHELAER